jgi:hypothetical protein
VASSVPFFLTAGSFVAAGGTGPFGRTGHTSDSSDGLVAAWRWSRESADTLRARSRGPGDVMTCPVPLAKKMVLQVAVRDIGQLTDI